MINLIKTSQIFFMFFILTLVGCLPTKLQAQAMDLFTYQVAGSSTVYTWEEAASPTPLQGVQPPNAHYFFVQGVAGQPGGSSIPLAFNGPTGTAGFNTYNINTAPSGECQDNAFCFTTSDPPIISGTTAAPTFNLGTYTGTDVGVDNGSTVGAGATLTIQAIAAPEPATYALLGTFLVALPILRASRRKTSGSVM